MKKMGLKLINNDDSDICISINPWNPCNFVKIVFLITVLKLIVVHKSRTSIYALFGIKSQTAAKASWASRNLP